MIDIKVRNAHSQGCYFVVIEIDGIKIVDELLDQRQLNELHYALYDCSELIESCINETSNN